MWYCTLWCVYTVFFVKSVFVSSTWNLKPNGYIKEYNMFSSPFLPLLHPLLSLLKKSSSISTLPLYNLSPPPFQVLLPFYGYHFFLKLTYLQWWRLLSSFHLSLSSFGSIGTSCSIPCASQSSSCSTSSFSPFLISLFMLPTRRTSGRQRLEWYRCHPCVRKYSWRS